MPDGWRGVRDGHRRQGTVFQSSAKGMSAEDRRIYAGLQAEQYAYLWERVKDTALPLAERVEATRELAMLARQGYNQAERLR